jgi:hypothetical protein
MQDCHVRLSSPDSPEFGFFRIRAARMVAFGQAANATRIKPITLEEMSNRYQPAAT